MTGSDAYLPFFAYGTLLPGEVTGLVAFLDQVESIGPDDPNPIGYRRERRIVRLANGQPNVAWVYAGDPGCVAG